MSISKSHSKLTYSNSHFITSSLRARLWTLHISENKQLNKTTTTICLCSPSQNLSRVILLLNLLSNSCHHPCKLSLGMTLGFHKNYSIQTDIVVCSTLAAANYTKLTTVWTHGTSAQVSQISLKKATTSDPFSNLDSSTQLSVTPFLTSRSKSGQYDSSSEANNGYILDILKTFRTLVALPACLSNSISKKHSNNQSNPQSITMSHIITLRSKTQIIVFSITSVLQSPIAI